MSTELTAREIAALDQAEASIRDQVEPMIDMWEKLSERDRASLKDGLTEQFGKEVADAIIRIASQGEAA